MVEGGSHSPNDVYTNLALSTKAKISLLCHKNQYFPAPNDKKTVTNQTQKTTLVDEMVSKSFPWHTLLDKTDFHFVFK